MRILAADSPLTTSFSATPAPDERLLARDKLGLLSRSLCLRIVAADSPLTTTFSPTPAGDATGERENCSFDKSSAKIAVASDQLLSALAFLGLRSKRCLRMAMASSPEIGASYSWSTWCGSWTFNAPHHLTAAGGSCLPAACRSTSGSVSARLKGLHSSS